MTVKFARWVLTQLWVWVQPASTGAQRGYSEKTALLMVVLGAASPSVRNHNSDDARAANQRIKHCCLAGTTCDRLWP